MTVTNKYRAKSIVATTYNYYPSITYVFIGLALGQLGVLDTTTFDIENANGTELTTEDQLSVSLHMAEMLSNTAPLIRVSF